jgi:competence protein ComGC
MFSTQKFIPALLLIAPLFATATHAAAQTGCAAKKQEIERQIDYAKAHGNQHRVNGLETALSEVNRNCTESSLRKDREDKIQEKERKVAERTEELKEARETGNQEKIGKKSKKLEEAKAELAEARAALNK